MSQDTRKTYINRTSIYQQWETRTIGNENFKNIYNSSKNMKLLGMNLIKHLNAENLKTLTKNLKWLK